MWAFTLRGLPPLFQLCVRSRLAMACVGALLVQPHVAVAIAITFRTTRLVAPGTGKARMMCIRRSAAARRLDSEGVHLRTSTALVAPSTSMDVLIPWRISSCVRVTSAGMACSSTSCRSFFRRAFPFGHDLDLGHVFQEAKQTRDLGPPDDKQHVHCG